MLVEGGKRLNYVYEHALFFCQNNKISVVFCVGLVKRQIEIEKVGVLPRNGKLV